MELWMKKKKKELHVRAAHFANLCLEEKFKEKLRKDSLSSTQFQSFGILTIY